MTAETRKRLPSLATVALAIAVLMLLLGVATPAVASSGFAHSSQQVVFGPDGTSQSGENTFWYLTSKELYFDRQDRRLYIFRPELFTSNGVTPPQPPRGIQAFDLSTPGVYAPLSGKYPLPLPQYGSSNVWPFAVDESEGNV